MRILLRSALSTWLRYESSRRVRCQVEGSITPRHRKISPECRQSLFDSLKRGRDSPFGCDQSYSDCPRWLTGRFCRRHVGSLGVFASPIVHRIVPGLRGRMQNRSSLLRATSIEAVTTLIDCENAYRRPIPGDRNSIYRRLRIRSGGLSEG